VGLTTRGDAAHSEALAVLNECLLLAAQSVRGRAASA
jgi:hypothetical protein